jgi:F420-dependent oxidoreductase-like protein
MLNTNAPIPDVTDEVRRAADAGFTTAVSSQIFAYDALTLLAVVGQQVPGIELATGVVPTYPRHPYVLAAQALTVQAATGGRLVLGIGLSHQPVIEGMFGYSFDKPARHMREYLDILLPLLRGEQVSYKGETVSVSTFGPIEVEAPAPQVLLAALAPRMLRLAGGVADGTMTWMTGPATVASHITPSITAAAEAASRPAPRIVVGLPVCVTADVDAARERAARDFVAYGYMPSYRAMLDREGAEGPADVVVVGDEESVVAQLATVAEAGATDFVAAPFGRADDRARTLALLAELARGAAP